MTIKQTNERVDGIEGRLKLVEEATPTLIEEVSILKEKNKLLTEAIELILRNRGGKKQ